MNARDVFVTLITALALWLLLLGKLEGGAKAFAIFLLLQYPIYISVRLRLRHIEKKLRGE